MIGASVGSIWSAVRGVAAHSPTLTLVLDGVVVLSSAALGGVVGKVVASAVSGQRVREQTFEVPNVFKSVTRFEPQRG